MTSPLDPTRMRRLAVALPALYAVRSLATVAWIAGIVVAAPAVGAVEPSLGLRVLLALYPAIDAIACLLDLRIDNSSVSRIAHRLEIGLGVVASTWALVDGHSWRSLVVVVGVWAVGTGLIQLVVALRRVRFVRGQWFMVVSGAGSVVAGASFVGWHGGGRALSDLMAQYAGGGLLWYAVAVIWAALLRPATMEHPT